MIACSHHATTAQRSTLMDHNFFKNKKRIIAFSGVVFLLVVFSLQATLSIRHKSPTYDEQSHVVRGLAFWQAPDLRINTHHPPVINAFAALPLIFDKNISVDFSDKNEDWVLADKNKLGNTLAPKLYNERNVLFKSRLMIIFLGMYLGLALFLFTKKYFGAAPAFIALTIYTFSPNILAHTRLVTTDFGATLAIFLAAWAFINYTEKHDKKSLALLFLALSFAALVKFNTIVIFPALLIAYAVFSWSHGHKIFSKEFIFRILKLAILGAITIFLIIALVYRFDTRTFKDAHVNPKRWDEFISLIEENHGTSSLQKRFIEWTATNIPIPGAFYYQGFYENVFKHNIYGHNTYLAGEYSKKGWWYYFPYAFFIKTPLPIIISLLSSVVLAYIFLKKELKKGKSIKKLLQKHSRLVSILILVLFYLAVSMRININLGLRHILPLYPFLFIFCALGIRRLISEKKLLSYLITATLLVWLALDSLIIFPNYLEFFNASVGGPKNGYLHLLDSNLFWNQDQYYVDEYVSNFRSLHPKTPIYVNPGCQPKTGRIIVGVDKLQGLEELHNIRYSWLRDNFPVYDRIAYTYIVYDVKSTEEIPSEYYKICENLE